MPAPDHRRDRPERLGRFESEARATIASPAATNARLDTVLTGWATRPGRQRSQSAWATWVEVTAGLPTVHG